MALVYSLVNNSSTRGSVVNTLPTEHSPFLPEAMPHVKEGALPVGSQV